MGRLFLTGIIAVCAGWDAAHAQFAPQLSYETIDTLPKTLEIHGTSAPAVERYKIRHEGHCVVGRLYGRYGDKSTLILPDGQLGIPSMLVPADQPFRPIAAEELGKRLINGPFKGYKLLKTDHYLILYQSTAAFAKNSGRLLDDLYEGLIEAFDRNGIPVHESEFPLVAVIFATELTSDAQDRRSRRAGVLRVLHESHLLLRNARPTSSRAQGGGTLKAADCRTRGCASDPLQHWCATSTQQLATLARRRTGRILCDHGQDEMCGLGTINALHMATIRELNDPSSIEVNAPNSRSTRLASRRHVARAESLMLETTLTPTDYARAWAITHYLASGEATTSLNTSRP